jgi:hypothetical protein
MTHIPYLQPGVRPDNDRSTRLLVMGILLIIMGGFGACFSLSLPFTLIMMRSRGLPGMPVRQMMAGMLFWPVIATMLIWTGIGSVQKRRWVRPIVLVFACFGLLAGIISVISTCIVIPVIAAGANMPMPMPAAMPATMRAPVSTSLPASLPTMAPTTMSTTVHVSSNGTAAFRAPTFANGVSVAKPIIAITIVTEVLFGVGVPLIFLQRYRGQEVRATLEFYDPHWRWTDACPIPVLGLAIGMAIGAMTVPMSAIPGTMFLFGVRVTGVPLVLVIIALAVLLVGTARQVYRVQLVGWQLAIGLVCVGSASWVMTLLLVPMDEIYRAHGMTDQQMQYASQLKSPTGMTLIAVIWTATAIAFVLYTRRFFPGGSRFNADATPRAPPIET